MATGFTTSKATEILSNAIKGSFVALSTQTPNADGSNFVEPAADTGYQRQSIGPLDTSIAGQVANADIIFLFEAVKDVGSVTHVGLGNSAVRGSAVFLMAQLNATLSIGTGVVPLIRAHGFVVGLDKALESY